MAASTLAHVSYEQLEDGSTNIIVFYEIVGDWPGKREGSFRDGFTEEGLASIRRKYDMLPGAKTVDFVSPNGSLPFPPVIKLFVRKALGVL
ncbi:MAG: hypothetical protein HY519_01015 [Candidatus Aenigmarchaeota archaeon]|nr:hypothetical protein [Candidatus Aenigmarchaeota archaeon]